MSPEETFGRIPYTNTSVKFLNLTKSSTPSQIAFRPRFRSHRYSQTKDRILFHTSLL